MSTASLIDPQPIEEEELKSMFDSELRNGMGGDDSELSTQRALAMERYLGEPDGREIEERSQVQSRDVLEVVEWFLPSLMRIFATQRAVEVDPVGPEDEQAAMQETDYLRHLFFKENSGFMIMYTWFKDALLQKVGVIKTKIDEDNEQKKEKYENLNDIEYQTLLADQKVEQTEHTARVVQGLQQGPMQLHNVTVLRRIGEDSLAIENLPPEEFVISRDARTVFPKDARFCAHLSSPTVSDMIEQGYSLDDLREMELGYHENEWSQETTARKNLADEQRFNQVDTSNYMMQTVKFAEGYMKCDVDGDGVAELLKIGRSGDYIEYEEVDDVPFDTLCPIPLSHKFYGLSLADILVELQDLRTGLLRAYVDNTHALINGKTYFNDRVNPDDMLTSKPWGTAYVEGDGPVSDAVLHVEPKGLDPSTFTLEEIIEKIKQQRVGDFQSQLDPDVLKNANNGVVVEMINESKAKIEMIARIFAETGVREHFRRLHKLSKQIGNSQKLVQLNNNWVSVHPAQWRDRTDFTIKVGLGTRNKQEAMATALGRIDIAERLVAGPYGPIVVPADRVFEMLKEMEEVNDEPNAEKFWQHPRNYQPPQPQPDPQIQAFREIEQMKNQTKQMELQMKNAEGVGKAQLERMKTEYDNQMQVGKHQVENLKAEAMMLKASTGAMEGENKILRDIKVKEVDALLDQLKLAMEHRSNTQEEMLKKYDIDMGAAVELMKTEALSEGRAANEKADETSSQVHRSAEQNAGLLTSLFNEITNLRSELNQPKPIGRDADGRMISIGNRTISYDEMGRPSGIG